MNVACEDWSWLNLKAQKGEHFTSQLSCVAARLLVTRICPVYLIDELLMVGVESSDKIMLQCFREVECWQDFTTEIRCKGYNV